MLLANLAGRFLLELTAIGAFGYWGYQVGGAFPTRIIFAVVAVTAFVLLWAFVIAPKAVNPIGPDFRILIGSGVLLVAAGALAMAGLPTQGLVFAALVVVNTVLLFALGHDVPATLVRSA
jgi:Protein of unknown function (DUF2568)